MEGSSGCQNITRQELTNKLLGVIYKLLEQIDDKDDINAAGLADKLSKLAAVVEKLDKRLMSLMPLRFSWLSRVGLNTALQQTPM